VINSIRICTEALSRVLLIRDFWCPKRAVWQGAHLGYGVPASA